MVDSMIFNLLARRICALARTFHYLESESDLGVDSHGLEHSQQADLIGEYDL